MVLTSGRRPFDVAAVVGGHDEALKRSGTPTGNGENDVRAAANACVGLPL